MLRIDVDRLLQDGVVLLGLGHLLDGLVGTFEHLAARKNEELQSVLDRANRVVKQVAEQEKYDLILQEAVYINPKHDITDKVIKALNAVR